MAITKLSVYNDALGILGKPAMSDVDEATESRRVMADHWPRTTETVFEEADWNCAIVREELTRLAETPTFGREYFYKLPAACVRIVQVSDTGDEMTPFESWREEQSRIVTDAEAIYLWYVSSTKIGTPGAWTQNLAGYVAADLAMRAAPRLAHDAIDWAKEERKRRRKLALALDARAAPPKRHTPGRWAQSRLGGIRFNPEQGR